MVINTTAIRQETIQWLGNFKAYTVAELVEWMKSRGGGFAEAFADEGMFRVSVNQEHVQTDHPVAAGDEIAFFLPISGGFK